jgi:hypothetical protein
VTWLGREPAFWIGLTISILVAIVNTLAGNGLISSVAAGNTTNTLALIGQLATILAPVIAGLLIRSQVTPTAAPVLTKGTTVTVVTPVAQPNTSATL